MNMGKNLVNENVTLEQLKENPAYSGYPEDILELMLVSGKMAKKYKGDQDIPKAPNALKCYKWYKKEVEAYTKKIEEAEQKCGMKCTCQKGCAFCCKQLIVITSVEMLALQLKIDNMSTMDKKRLKDIVNEQCSFLKANGITNERINEINPYNGFNANEKKIQTEYFNLKVTIQNHPYSKMKLG